jgi:uncharacterized protein YukE
MNEIVSTVMSEIDAASSRMVDHFTNKVRQSKISINDALQSPIDRETVKKVRNDAQLQMKEAKEAYVNALSKMEKNIEEINTLVSNTMSEIDSASSGMVDHLTNKVRQSKTSINDALQSPIDRETVKKVRDDAQLQMKEAKEAYVNALSKMEKNIEELDILVSNAALEKQSASSGMVDNLTNKVRQSKISINDALQNPIDTEQFMQVLNDAQLQMKEAKEAYVNALSKMEKNIEEFSALVGNTASEKKSASSGMVDNLREQMSQ